MARKMGDSVFAVLVNKMVFEYKVKAEMFITLWPSVPKMIFISLVS